MKIRLFVCLMVCLVSTNVFSQSNGLAFGGLYEIIISKGNQIYLDSIASKLDLKEHIDLSNPGGIAIYYTSKSGPKTEGEAGISLLAKNAVLKNDSGASLGINNRIAGLHFGLNYYPTRWLVAGAQFKVSNFSGRVKYSNPASDTLFQFTPDNINFMIGYSVGIRPQVGFSIPFTPANSNKDRGMRILAFYDLGLSRYRFYDAYDKIMPFEGNKKTFTSGYGVELTFYFRGS
ncbi:MAG: hypothetical protein ACKVOK_10730 [Flavobacteriales bacterium]